jgi:hypothetical protein
MLHNRQTGPKMTDISRSSHTFTRICGPAVGVHDIGSTQTYVVASGRRKTREVEDADGSPIDRGERFAAAEL